MPSLKNMSINKKNKTLHTVKSNLGHAPAIGSNRYRWIEKGSFLNPDCLSCTYICPLQKPSSFKYHTAVKQ